MPSHCCQVKQLLTLKKADGMYSIPTQVLILQVFRRVEIHLHRFTKEALKPFVCECFLICSF